MADDFEKIFGERLGSLEGEPSADQWQKISNRLKKDRWRERWLLVAILLPLLLTVPVILMVDSKVEPAKIVQSPAIEENPMVKSAAPDPSSPETVARYPKDQIAESMAPVSGSNLNSVAHSNEKDNIEINNSNFKKIRKNILPVDSKRLAGLSQGAFKFPAISTSNSDPVEEKTIIAEQDPMKKRLSLIISLTPNLNYGIFQPGVGDEILINGFDQSAADRLGMNFSLGVGYPVSPRLSLELQGTYRYYQQRVTYSFQDLNSGSYQAIVEENSLLITPDFPAGSKQLNHDFSGFGFEFGVLYHLKNRVQNQSLVTGLSVFLQNQSTLNFFNLGYRFSLPLGNQLQLSLQPQVSYNLSPREDWPAFRQRNYNAGLKVTIGYSQ